MKTVTIIEMANVLAKATESNPDKITLSKDGSILCDVYGLMIFFNRKEIPLTEFTDIQKETFFKYHFEANLT